MISEIDIKDWEKNPKTKKLYEVGSDSIVSTAENPETPFLFRHIDGMYSFCTELNNPERYFHVYAGALVNEWEKKSTKSN